MLATVLAFLALWYRLFVALGELLDVLLLVAEDLDHLLALHHLLDEAVHAAQVLLLGHKVAAGEAAELFWW